MDRVWNKLLCVLIVAGLGAASASAALAEVIPGKPSAGLPPLPEFSLTGGVGPLPLPRTRPAPVALALSIKVGRYEGGHPPALRELAVLLDKNTTLGLGSYPFCHGAGIRIDPPMTLEERCKSSLIGAGTAHVEIDASEAEPTVFAARLLIFNGVLKNGVRTLYVDMAFSDPVPGHLVTRVEIKKIHEGPFATEATFAFPKIAGGNGSITSLDLRIRRRLPLEGTWFSPVFASCPDNRLQVGARATFFDYRTGESIKAGGELLRTCAGR